MDIFYDVLEHVNELDSKSKYIIYPYGKVGQIVRTILDSKKIEYIIVDKNNFDNVEIFPTQILKSDKYKDFLIILSYISYEHESSIVNTLKTNNIDKSRVIRIVSEKYLSHYIFRKKEDKSIYDMVFHGEPRQASLERAAREIYEKNIKGNVAEVGVFRGEFSAYINWWFNDRMLYLVDTFEGFDKKDIHVDRLKDYSDGCQDFSDTSVEYVLSQMPNREKCIIKKGWFPESMSGVDDEFCFVSLDTDLYQPIYAGLEFFYDKLVHGGYIFIHDCANEGYKGARQAVIDFAEKNNIGYVMLPDGCGTAVITK